MFDKLKPLPNHIFIPKIVPLVYDDTLSYYEFVCKLYKKLEEMITALNELGVRVDALEEAVRQLQDIINGLDDRLTTLEGDMITVKGDIETINGAITNINTAIDGINGQLTTINVTLSEHTNSINTINNSIRDIEDLIASLEDVPGDIADLEQDVSGLDTRVANLESATFGDISIAPTPKNFSCNMMMFDKLVYEIVKPENYDTSLDDTVKIEYGCFRFRGASNYNQTHLKLPNFCPKLANSEALTLAIVFADYYSEYGQALDTTFGDLVNGVSMIVGVTNEICVGGAKLVLNTDGDYQMYDLHLYVQAQNGSGTYIANSRFYLEWVAILGGVGYLTQGRGSADNIRPYMNAYNGGIPETGVKQADFNALADRVTVEEGKTSDLETAIGTFTQAEYNTDFNNLQGDITSLSNEVSGIESTVSTLESIDIYQGMGDIFDMSTLLEGVSVQYFRAYKYGAVRVIDTILTNFPRSSNYSCFKVATIRSAKVSEWSPLYPVNVCATGLPTSQDNPPRILVGENPPYVSGRSVKNGIATLMGSGTTNPFNEGGQYHDTSLSSNSLYVGIENDYNDYNNSIHLRMVYLVGGS